MKTHSPNGWVWLGCLDTNLRVTILVNKLLTRLWTATPKMFSGGSSTNAIDCGNRLAASNPGVLVLSTLTSGMRLIGAHRLCGRRRTLATPIAGYRPFRNSQDMPQAT